MAKEIRVKRILGLILVLIGLSLLLMNKTITGNMIGSYYSNSISFIAAVFFLIGAVLLIAERKKTVEHLLASGVPKLEIDSVQKGIRDEYDKMPNDQRKTLYKETANIMEQVRAGSRAGGTYNLHLLNGIPRHLTGLPPAIRILEGDARVLNHYAGQRGRGTERYIFDSKTSKLLGIAYHPRGKARDLKWRVKF